MAAQRDAFDDDEDTHVRVGTAFKLLETDEDIAKHKEKKLKEQYVRDKQGRIRFHGAFTGGFSAGYYNTVGSKEGWAPSAFTSSRSSKQQSKQQRPEDFMDEEDLDVFGIAPREISTRDLFNKEAFGVDQGGIRNASSVIPGVPPLQDLIVPAKSTIGARLLKAMGWKEGQGVGPKISRPIMTNPSASQRVYGCSLPQEDESFMFAPNDVAPWKYHSKEDSHGIGYQGMLEQGALSSTTTSRSLYGMYGQAFGVGALEEEDEDIYAQENLMSYSTTISSEGELSRSQKFGWTGSSYEAWSLDSFNKMSSKWRLLKKFPPPDVPKHFVAAHVFTDKAPEVNLGTISRNERHHAMADTSEQSVFNYMSMKDKERIQQLAKATKSGGPPAANSSHVKIPPARERQPPKEPAVKALDKKKPVLASQPSKNIVCQTILSGTYQPFADNPSKQLRYEAYLSGKRKFNDKESANFTEWEKHKELEEFSRKTRLLRPLTTQLSDKFTHGGTISAETSEDTSYKKDDASSEAAMMGMFGIMTRETFQWHPHKMLCRRFNIPSPYPNSDVVGVPQDVSKEKKRNEVEFASSNVVVQNDEQFDVEEEEEQKEDEENFEEQSVLELEESVRRPPHSTFVSIFADDSSSDEQENEEEEAQDQVEESSAIKGWQNLSLISQQTLTQPVDVPIKIPSAQEPHPPVVQMETATSHDTEEFFGPPLPPPLDDTSLDHHDDNLQDNGHHSDHHHHHHKKRKHSSSHKKSKHKRYKH